VDHDDPITVDGLRERLTYIRDNALERPDMTPHERGRIAGSRDMLAVVLAMLDRVQCTCEPPARPAQAPVLRLLPNGSQAGTIT
jgi:hypothetical protein